MDLSEEDILNEIIIGYRQLIEQRYQYQFLKTKYTIPEDIDTSIVEEIKYFFLTYIYPDVERRLELNEAFQSLDDNIRRPDKLFGLLGESIKLVFKHGRHLPKIMLAGLKALRSYRSATRFENALVQAAQSQQMKPPYSSSKIYTLIQTLSIREIDQFIENTESLFLVLLDEDLVHKIKEVLAYLIERMRINTAMFSDQDIRGLEIGLEMLSKGDKVLKQLSEENKNFLIRFIVQVEKDQLNELFL